MARMPAVIYSTVLFISYDLYGTYAPLGGGGGGQLLMVPVWSTGEQQACSFTGQPLSNSSGCLIAAAPAFLQPLSTAGQLFPLAGTTFPPPQAPLAMGAEYILVQLVPGPPPMQGKQCCGSESEIIRIFWLNPNP
jgi:hypothetical protein